ncbi:MAG: radical SAM protein [Deltaproteobacteria bacterium]|nr:radical SAM protein [Deltaproteobacteria bacterium]
MPRARRAPRARRPEDGVEPRPLYAVWELTLRCDQACAHCGSRAGRQRERELSTIEARELGRALREQGCREVALSGGEAYLREDLPEIVTFLKDQGMRVALQTGGRGLTSQKARSLAAAGLDAVGVSVDGTEPVHDQLRGGPGSHAAALRALDAAGEAGLAVTANTQVNRLNQPELPAIAAELRAHGAMAWLLMPTVPMGHAADRPEWILAPWQIVEVIDTLAEIQLAAARTYAGGPPFDVCASDALGYFGRHEQALRSRPGGDDAYWNGCPAGKNIIGIESDGTIKACASLPTAAYAAGNVRERSLEQIWKQPGPMSFARERLVEELWGFCRTCYFAEHCLGGCSLLAHCTLGRRGNNPFCYHRVTELKKRGIRERLVMKDRAPRDPFAVGRFDIVAEPWHA